MKRYLKAFGVFGIAAVMVFGMAACAPAESTFNPYDVATELGYEGTKGSWMSQNAGSDSEIKRLYDEAKQDGYEGTFVEFLREIGYTGDAVYGVNRALTTTVMVVSNFKRGGFQFGSGGSDGYASMGAGVIYSLDKEKGDAYIITNYHVLYSSSSAGNETVAHISDDVDLYLYGGVISGRKVDATYVGGAMEYDIAVLKVEDSEILRDSSASAAAIGNSDAIAVGQAVYAVGNPDAQGFSVSSGIVSVDAEEIDITVADGSSTVRMLEIRTDAAVNHGNSGGGLYDAEGKLVGIVNARSEASGVESFGYAIPSNLAVAVAQNIIDNSKANTSRGALRAMLGVTVQTIDSQGVYDEDTGRVYIMETIEVQGVTEGAVAAGKLQAGDMIYALRINNGAQRIITRMYMLTNTLFDVRKGDTVTILIMRGEELVEVKIEYNDNSNFKLFA